MSCSARPRCALVPAALRANLPPLLFTHAASLPAFFIPQLPSLAELLLGGEEDEYRLETMLLGDMQWPSSATLVAPPSLLAMPPACTPLPLEHTTLAFSPPPAPLDLHLAPLLPPPCEAAFHPGIASSSLYASSQRAVMRRTPPKLAASGGSSPGAHMPTPTLQAAHALYRPAAPAARPASHLPTITTGDRWIPSKTAVQLHKRARC